MVKLASIKLILLISAFNASFIEQAKSLFGEQRYFTESERKLYKKVTEAQSKDLGINVFDLMRERNASRVG